MVGTLSVLGIGGHTDPLYGTGLNSSTGTYDIAGDPLASYAWNVSGQWVDGLAAVNPTVATLQQRAIDAASGGSPTGTLLGDSLTPILAYSSDQIADPYSNYYYTGVSSALSNPTSVTGTTYIDPLAVGTAIAISDAINQYPTISNNTGDVVTVSVVSDSSSDDGSSDGNDEDGDHREVNGAGFRPPGWDIGVGNPHGNDGHPGRGRGRGHGNG